MSVFTSTASRASGCKWLNTILYHSLFTFLFTSFYLPSLVCAQAPFQVNPGSIGNAQTLCVGADPAPLTNVTAAVAGPVVSAVVLADKPLNLGATNWGYKSTSGEQQIAEDFTLSAPAQATLVRFSGWFPSTNATTGSFDILFFQDAGGLPATEPFFSFNTGPLTGVFQGIDASLGGGNIYQWTVAFTPVSFAAPGKYWICIRDTEAGTDFAWESATPNGDHTVVSRGTNTAAWSGSSTFTDTDAQALRIEGESTGPGAITYQWQSNATGCNGDYNNIPAATGETFDPGPLTMTTYYRRVATSMLNGVPFAANSNCVAITITACGPPQGCEAGYWKNHLEAWPNPYSPGQILESVFDIPDSYGLDNVTLRNALAGGGGPGAAGAATILLRSAVAALLNAQHSGVNHPRTVTSIINDVNATLASGNRNAMLQLASALEADNKLGCPLNNSTYVSAMTSAARSEENATTAKLSAVAAPNPFSDRIKFTVEAAISGQASIEVFNSVGQKLGTAFNGYVSAGKKQVIDYHIPAAQRQNIFYVFRVGDQQMTGKLINIGGRSLQIR